MEKDDDLRRIAPKLSSLEKKDIYLTPEGLFDDLPYSVQMAVSGKVKLSFNDWIFRIISISMTSAIILCICIITYFSFFQPQPALYTKTGSENINHPQGYYYISNYLSFE